VSDIDLTKRFLRTLTLGNSETSDESRGPSIGLERSLAVVENVPSPPLVWPILVRNELTSSALISVSLGGAVETSAGLSESLSMSPRSKLLVEASSRPKINGGRKGGPTSTAGSPELVFASVRGRGETLFVLWTPWSGRVGFENGSLGISKPRLSFRVALSPG